MCWVIQVERIVEDVPSNLNRKNPGRWGCRKWWRPISKGRLGLTKEGTNFNKWKACYRSLNLSKGIRTVISGRSITRGWTLQKRGRALVSGKPDRKVWTKEKKIRTFGQWKAYHCMLNCINKKWRYNQWCLRTEFKSHTSEIDFVPDAPCLLVLECL